MNEHELDRFEQQITELVSAAKALVKEFENRIGEAVNAQRLAASEAREEGVQVQQKLKLVSDNATKLLAWHNQLLEAQKATLGQLEATWKQEFVDLAGAAGAAQAKTFGESIAAGLRQQLESTAQDVRRATGQFHWQSTLRWALGIAMAVPLTIALGVWAFFPRIEGVPMLHARVAMSHLAACEYEKQIHVCVAIDEKPRVVSTPDNGRMVVVREM